MDDTDRIVAWAERQAGADALPQKRAQGRAGHLSAQEKHTIRLAYLESGGTVTFKALAARFGVNRDTVSACCKGPEFRALEKHLEVEVRASAVSRLKALTLPAVDAWGDAIPIAAQKGDHRPARELLQHVGIVEDNKDAGRGMLVLTRIEVNGVPAIRGSDGHTYEFNPETGEIENLPKVDMIVGVGIGESVNVGDGGPGSAPTVIELNGFQLHGMGINED